MIRAGGKIKQMEETWGTLMDPMLYLANQHVAVGHNILRFS